MEEALPKNTNLSMQLPTENETVTNHRQYSDGKSNVMDFNNFRPKIKRNWEPKCDGFLSTEKAIGSLHYQRSLEQNYHRS